MRTFAYGAAVTVLALLGSLILGFAIGEVVFNLIPGHSIDDPQLLHILLAALPTFAGLILGSALWGVLLGRLAHAPDPSRMAIAGVLGFAPITIALALGLGSLEPIAVETLVTRFPIHRIFTFLFVPSAFLIAGVSAFAIGIGLRDSALARTLFWRVGGVSALAFLAVNLMLEFLGWHVGGPGAAERTTMLTVLFLSNLAAAVVGGGVMGLVLQQPRIVLRNLPPLHVGAGQG